MARDFGDASELSEVTSDYLVRIVDNPNSEYPVDKLIPGTDMGSASAISVLDTGNYYTGTNVETVLAEVGAGLLDVYVQAGASIQAALTACRLAGGGRVKVGPGTFSVTLQNHPLNSGYKCGLIIGANTELSLDPATVVKLADSETNDGSNYMLINYTLGGGDTGIVVRGGVFDGNAVNQTILMSGVTFIRAADCSVVESVSKNMRGTAGDGAGETFHFETIFCTNITFSDCLADCDDAGETASGFSADASSLIRWHSCTARNMANGQGFTHNNGSLLKYVACSSYLNAANQFNSELADDVVYEGCSAGGSIIASDDAYPYAAGLTLGNGTGRGFAFNGSNTVQVVGCTAKGFPVGIIAVGDTTGTITGGDFSQNTTPFSGSFVGFTPTQRVGIYLPGAGTDYISTADAAGLDITGDIDLRAVIAPADWTPAAVQRILAKWTASGNQRSYMMDLGTSGALRVLFSSDGSSFSSALASVTFGAQPAGTALAVAALIDIDNGAGGASVNFYKHPSLDPPSDIAGWTQLGTTVTATLVAAVYSSTSELRIGTDGDAASAFAGVIHRAQVRDGLGGTLVADYRAVPFARYLDSVSRGWIVNGSAWLVTPASIV